jgi:Fe-S-cluster containining protein
MHDHIQHVEGWKTKPLTYRTYPLTIPRGVLHTPLILYSSSLCPLCFATMSRGSFKLRDNDDNAYYQGYKAAVSDNLPIEITYGEGQETRHYFKLSNF